VSAPAVSVLVPTYNYARYLPEAIDSVLAQDFKDFELIIADDCSTDDTAGVVKAYLAKDSRIQFIARAKNLGMVNNWNDCLQRARGEYIKFLFGDDKLFRPDALGKMVAMLKDNSSATLAASARVIFDENSKVVNVWRNFSDGCHNGHEVITQYLMVNGRNLVGEPSAAMFRRADAKRGFDPQYKQIVDVEMWFHLLEKGNLVYTREPLCGFRVHSLQQTERNTGSGLAWKEHSVFMAGKVLESSFPRKVVFPILFHLRRWQEKTADAGTPEMLEWQRKLAARWGAGWKLFYWLYCIRHRMAKPFQNFRRSLEKRRFVREFNAGGSS
jgi:glycosyltransferase involved in cell wall biosynthesis